MRRRLSALATCLLLGACIPQVDSPRRAPPPPRYPAPSPRVQPRQPLGERVQQLPAPRPAWEIRGAAADAHYVAAQTWVVRPGDTLSHIADRTGAGVTVIAAANGLTAPSYTVRAGQRLTIPPGRYHLVRAGQTGIAIARVCGVEWSRIVAANDLAEPYVLRTGQRILIPGGTQPTSAAERAAAFKLDIDDIITGGEPAIAANQRPAAPVETPRRALPATVAISAPIAPPGRFLWPVEGQVVARFGAGQSGERNDGINIAVPLGTPIRSTADGTVAYVGDAITSMGGLVVVTHGEGWTSVYGHASKLLVQRGQAVKKGQTLALSGATGYADRPEVHFELRRGRGPVDPLTQLPRE